MLDQANSWSWTNDSSSHQFRICLSLLHCSAISTSCSIYTFFFLPIHLTPVMSLADGHAGARFLSFSMTTTHLLHVQMGSVLCNWEWWRHTGITELPELHYIQRELIISIYCVYLWSNPMPGLLDTYMYLLISTWLLDQRFLTLYWNKDHRMSKTLCIKLFSLIQMFFLIVIYQTVHIAIISLFLFTWYSV